MLQFGIVTITTDASISTVELARWMEAHDFESLFMGAHSHIPTSRRTPFPSGGALPEIYKHFADPFIELAAAAAVTERLKIGTSVCLMTEHHPIALAKTVANLDRLSRGRFLFGIGAGWNVEEMANHGVEFKDRWKVARERVLAMRAIWTNAEAEFHGQFVNFDPIWCWPKPVQASGPPVLLGVGATKGMPKRVVEYGDGWMPVDGLDDVAAGVAAIRAEAARVGRSFADFDLSVLAGYGIYGAAGTERRITELAALGFTRILLVLDAVTPDKQWRRLEQFVSLMKQCR
ncbi:MAG: LLM class F420-dependent oxidoreductase [Deltaproteobacteria bacterium]|nr:LLM class F420-dependent oxidoreductase [Deltaproteobacteria bacterium]